MGGRTEAEAESKWREERSAEENGHRSALKELLNNATAEQGAVVGRAMATLEGVAGQAGGGRRALVWKCSPQNVQPTADSSVRWRMRRVT